VKHAAALKQTGGGLWDGENPSDENSDVVFDFYIPLSGPDHDTPAEAKHLWGESSFFIDSFTVILYTCPTGAITVKWPFFPRLFAKLVL